MDSLELQVKSLDEAIEAACQQWGVSSDEVKATVLEEIPGLFGKTKLKVRVERVAAKPAKAARAPRAAKAKAEPAPEPVVEEAVEEPVVEAEAPKKPARGRKKAEAEPKPVVAAAPAAEDKDENGDAQEVVEATEEDAGEILNLMREILNLAGLTADVKVRDLNGRYVNLQLDGPDVVHLVGKNGEALNHLQYLMNVMISRQIANGVRITLDGNEFRSRREEKLRSLARHVAQQVVDRGEEAVFDALPAFERRVVHQELAEFEGVATYSEGEEPNRRVVIAPAG